MDLDFGKFERIIANDKKLYSTIASFITVLILFLNMEIVNSFILGATATCIFFVINATFLGHAFFEE